MTTTRWRAALAFILVLGTSVATARADKASAKARAKQADVFYKLGQFEQALAVYSAAYEDYPAAGLLFNIGQCHKNLKHWERARFFFEGYLRERPDTANRAVVEELIAEARHQEELALERARELERVRRAEAERQEARDQRAAEESARARLLTTPPPVPATAAEQGKSPRPHDPGRRRPVYKRWWFWAGVGAVAVGATAFALVRSDGSNEPDTHFGTQGF
ncbi:MAG: tetratricopeptide repeat protein [Deltaproteobacteria bacterium]|nr:tetratricopeptide repeat protein [Deltaproteobacteria bacterium]